MANAVETAKKKRAIAHYAPEVATMLAIVEAIDATDGDPVKIDAVLDQYRDKAGDAIAALLTIMDDEISLVNALTTRIQALSVRKNDLESAAERKRAFILQFMLMSSYSETGIKLPEATISIKKNPDKLEVTDESAVPTDFFVTPPPKLDRTALKEALKNIEAAKAAAEAAGAEINVAEIRGAQMVDGGYGLTIRH